MPSLVNTLPTVRGLMNSRVPISGLEKPSRASRAMNRRSLLLLFLVDLRRLVPAGAMALDYFRLNFCRISSDEDAAVFAALRSRTFATLKTLSSLRRRDSKDQSDHR
jgi:hypothetical protein